MADDSIEIIRGGEELLDAPHALWLALRDHHHAIAPELGAVRSDEDAWTRRRAQYAAWLAEDNGAFLLVARRGEHVLAYAFIRPVERTSTTWATERRELDIETLSVSPEARGTGIGARMIALIREEVGRGGYGGLQVTAIAQNVDALRFYEREGFAPEFIHLRDTTRTP
ncbi:GNAT family N-acetyltransferase [Baekduia sp.]|jgi:GNAT superfamily N-acetyltransferase|uniref:GNAT family N-acetyltransferase n=1 Tax=Baekduia sp. TaxID=2600305 RepID=UPI002DFC2CF7|nr:GNAT family N-acetyltransferase [Baekduia sp.]